MINIARRLYRTSPREAINLLLKNLPGLGNRQRETPEFEAFYAELRQRFSVYSTDRLVGISPEEFEKEITERIGKFDASSENYSHADVGKQRDLSIRFHWGHDHDFGTFSVKGRMEDRHLTMLARFATLFSIKLDDFKDKQVFDIGCWTGGTALALATLGSSVYAIEEVKKYAETAQYLANAFGINDRLTVDASSLYSCNVEELSGRFDIVHFPGVIYHLSDPVVALRILFNSLRDGGFILIESAGLDSDQPYCLFEGSLVYSDGDVERLNRGGWNWFIPSPSALKRWMVEAGFDNVTTSWWAPRGRILAFGRKRGQTPICRAGLSVRDIR